MVLIGLLTLALIVSAVLIILGFYFKKRAYFLTLAGSVILVVVGISLLSQGVNFVSGTTQTVINNTTTIILNDTTNQQNSITEILGWSIMLFGFIGFIGGSIALNKTRFDSEDMDDRPDNDFKF